MSGASSVSHEPSSKDLPNSVGEWLRCADQDIDRLDRELLYCTLADVSRAHLIAHPEQSIAPIWARLQAGIARLRDHEPLAYLLGSREFWGLELTVTPDVLVPRPETELLVEIALKEAPGVEALRALDLGTGSGAIALALASERPAWQILGTDASEAALAIAASNGVQLGLPVRWQHSHWFDAITGRFDLIVSNPPYIRACDPHLPALRHEPQQALVSDPSGLQALRDIISIAPAYLAAGGLLVVEHGYDQADEVGNLFAAAGFADVSGHRDLANLDRATSGRKPSGREVGDG